MGGAILASSGLKRRMNRVPRVPTPRLNNSLDIAPSEFMSALDTSSLRIFPSDRLRRAGRSMIDVNLSFFQQQ